MSVARRAKTLLDVGSGILVSVAAIALLWTLYRTSTPASVTQAARPQIEAVAELSIDAARATKRVGNGSIVLVEFTDFQCPFCARHALETYPSLRRDLIDQDRLTYLAFAFPLERIHPYARKASEAAECAAKQGRYWEMHERIFANQRALKNPDFLAETAREIGLDEKLLEICLSSQASDAVAADIAEGERLDVNSTPTFFLGRRQPNGAIKLEKRIRGLVAFEHLSDAIEEVERSE